jgi:hypothetical protein
MGGEPRLLATPWRLRRPVILGRVRIAVAADERTGAADGRADLADIEAR